MVQTTFRRLSRDYDLRGIFHGAFRAITKLPGKSRGFSNSPHAITFLVEFSRGFLRFQKNIFWENCFYECLLLSWE
jgi:hypothetical protein